MTCYDLPVHGRWCELNTINLIEGYAKIVKRSTDTGIIRLPSRNIRTGSYILHLFHFFLILEEKFVGIAVF